MLSDVLEHAVAPDRLLRLLAPKLADGGRVCVSVPNARFWSEFARPRGAPAVAAAARDSSPPQVAPLLDGTWDYGPHGVLDRTHVRWFTHASFLKMAAAAGFEEDGPALRVHFGEAHKAPMVLLEAVAAALGDGAATGLYEESDVRQFLVPLRRAAPRAAAGAEL